MPILHAIILGLVQGLTEFLPVSSSGHLIVFPELLGWDVSSVTFDVAIHVATLGAIVVALKDDIIKVIKGIVKNNENDKSLALKIVVATIPAVVIGGLFHNAFESWRSMTVVGAMLIVWGVVLFVADEVAKRTPRMVLLTEKMPWLAVLLIGLAQVLAFVPGTSRSGVTMSVGLLAGLSKETAAKFSFFLAIPAILGAGAVTFLEVLQNGLDVPIPSLVAGSIAAFVSGIFAIRFLLLIIKKWSFAPFAIYRVVFGVILLIVSVLKY
ncbi:MAG: undecaprenyl-diphosphatase UppP [Patescibacteria group bacterium]|jgi:undecaprenyl-diphosphatase